MRRITRDQWSKEHDTCFVCRWRIGDLSWALRWLETHEIARGIHRAAGLVSPACWIRTCNVCHTEKLDGMAIVEQLAYKKVNDPEFYNAVDVNQARGRSIWAITDAEVDEAIERLRL